MLRELASASPSKKTPRVVTYIEANFDVNWKTLDRHDDQRAKMRCQICSQARLRMPTRKLRKLSESFLRRIEQKTKQSHSNVLSSKPSHRLLLTLCLKTPRSSKKHSKKTRKSWKLSALTKNWKSERRAIKQSSGRRRSPKLPPPRIKTLAACLSFST